MNYKKDIADLYESIQSGEYDESEKEDLKDYTKLIYEGSGHGDEKVIKNALKDAVHKGLISVEPTKKGWKVLSKVSQDQYVVDKGESSYHYLRRFLQKLEQGRKSPTF